MITATVTGGAVQLTGNPVFINCAGASIPAGASEYMIMLKIISADGKLEGAPLLDAIVPDTNGAAIFEISGILDQPYEVTFDNVNFDGNTYYGIDAESSIKSLTLNNVVRTNDGVIVNVDTQDTDLESAVDPLLNKLN